jgi:putative membrane protein
VNYRDGELFRLPDNDGGMKTHPIALRCALVVSALSLCTTLSAETTTSSTTTTERHATATTTAEAKLSRNDRNFFEHAAKSGMKEVDVSRSVLDRLTNPQVKQFAQMMVDDHSGANTELASLAASKGVTLPVKETKAIEKWSKKTDELDEDYMEEMVSDHEKAVKLFEEAAKSKDPQIAAFASKTLPKLQAHLTQARTLEKLVDD